MSSAFLKIAAIVVAGEVAKLLTEVPLSGQPIVLFNGFYPRPADSISHSVCHNFLHESVIILEKSLNGHNSANFEATTSRFCMVIDLNETYMMMMTMMMMMMIKMKLIINRPILKLQPPDFAW